MCIRDRVSTIFEFIGPDKNIPRVKSRRSSTTIRVKNGESIIIGGLLSNDRKETTYRLPILSKIPWLGEKLFTSRNLVERKTDLIIQITPKIVVDTYTGIMKTDRMKAVEKGMISVNNDKDEAISDEDNSENMNESDSYQGIWINDGALPESSSNESEEADNE